MKKCQLCNAKPADKKGSHIVPHFLTKRIFNDSGDTQRDKEFIFPISDPYKEPSFGRAVAPEKIEKVFGGRTEEAIENNRLYGVVDNYFCSDCESNLAVIESKYAQTMNSNSKIGENYTSIDTPFIGFLFWTSIVWRSAIEEETRFILQERDREKLGRILRRYLKLDIKEIIPNKDDKDLNDIAYKLIRSPNFSKTNNTFLLAQAHEKGECTFIVDEFILFYSFEKDHDNAVEVEFYGSEVYVPKAIYNTPFCPESIYGLLFEEYEKIYSSVCKIEARVQIEEWGKELDKLHIGYGGEGEKMDEDLKKVIIARRSKLGTCQPIIEHSKIILKTMLEYNDSLGKPYNLQ